MTIGTGAKGRRSVMGGRGPKSRGGVPSRDGKTSGGSMSQEEAKRQRVIDEAREQQEEMQAWVQAIMVTQGGGTPGPSTVVAVPIPRACERCMLLLQEPKGCMVSEWGKVRACLPCQKACKACVWSLGPGDAGAAMSSGTEVSGKPAPR